MEGRRTNLLGVAGAMARAKAGRESHIYLIHAVTARCNATCTFCAWTPDNKPEGELTLDEIKKLYSDARKAGFVYLSLWGGEPLVHRDISEIARFGHELGFATNMITNGALLERKMDDVLPYIDRLCISLDYPSERHDEVRGINGLYEKIVEATKLARQKHPKTKILFGCTLMRDNTDDASLRALARLAKSLGVMILFTPMRDEYAVDSAEGADLTEHMATDEQLSAAYKRIAMLKLRGYPVLNSYTYIGKLVKGRPRYNCHWPKFMLPIEANGDVVDCMKWGVDPITNIREKPFAEILKEPRLRALSGEKGEACHKCVSVHRVEVSEIYRGNLEPLIAWGAGMR